MSFVPADTKLTVDAETLEAARAALRPGRRPRGYFGGLVVTTGILMRDKGFKLGEAADWLIWMGKLPVVDREGYLNAMRQRFHRERAAKVVTGAVLRMRSVYFNQEHFVEHGGEQALCGVRAGGWSGGVGGVMCARCVGAARRLGLKLEGVEFEQKERKQRKLFNGRRGK